MPDRVALYLQDAHELKDAINYVQYAEQNGFEAVWQAESRLVRDAIVPMAAFAATTRKIKIGSGVINNWTRNASLIAATYLTLDDLAPDRIICGIGAWWDPLAANVGIQRSKPLLAMRETVTVVRDLLAMKRVTFHGEFVNVTGLVAPAYNADALAALEQGAKVAGRSLESIDRPQLVVASVDRDRKKALDGARKLVTQYLGQQPHIMKASGVSQELLDDIAQVLTWPATEEQIERAMALVPDDVVQLITASGTPEEVRAKVREYVANGCTCPVLYPLGDDVRLMIDTFADGYSQA